MYLAYKTPTDGREIQKQDARHTTSLRIHAGDQGRRHYGIKRGQTNPWKLLFAPIFRLFAITLVLRFDCCTVGRNVEAVFIFPTAVIIRAGALMIVERRTPKMPRRMVFRLITISM